MANGASAFDQYYRSLFGERWDGLTEALRAERRHVRVPGPLVEPYYVDPASVAVARLLPIDGAERILDMCAAPGGKTLVLAGRMPGRAHLVANERSATRRGRLKRVLDAHLGDELRSRVSVTGHDAARWALYEPQTYDAVLADVPCSSEQHVLNDPAELARWSRSRSKRIAATQHAILAAAIDTARPGGYVLYATCALAPRENDEVVARAAKKRSARFEVIARAGMQDRPGEERPGRGHADHDSTSSGNAEVERRIAAALERVEETEFGLQILPDHAAGAGPLYFALLKRV